MAKDEFDSQSLIHDRFAIALVDSDLAFLGHITKFMSKPTLFFLKDEGHTKWEITGIKKFSKDL